MFTELLPQILFLLGVGFLVANVRVGFELVRWQRRRASALIVWPGKKPPYYGLSLAIGVTLGLLLIFNAGMTVARIPEPRPGVGSLVQALTESPRSLVLFGELMMFVYYGYAVPLSTRIARGLYGDGIWTDAGFMPYDDIGGLRWKEDEPPTLIVIARTRALARPLIVPGAAFGEVRHLLRDKIASHAIAFDDGPGLHLGERDVRDSV
jgi:hypothetical protein